LVDHYNSKIIALSGDTNGANKSFGTPTKYVAGTLRVVWNGQVYEPDDTKWGWSETSDQTIETITAPRNGDVMQAFYQDKTAAGQIGVEGVKGSPFHPTGLLP